MPLAKWVRANPRPIKKLISKIRKRGAGSRVAGRVKRKPVRRVRKRASGSNIAGKMRRARPWKIRKTKRPVKKASGSNVAGRVRRKKASGYLEALRVRRKPVRRKRASGSLVAGGKWKDRLTYVPNKIVEHTFGRLAKSIWKRNRRR